MGQWRLGPRVGPPAAGTARAGLPRPRRGPGLPARPPALAATPDTGYRPPTKRGRSARRGEALSVRFRVYVAYDRRLRK